VASGGVGNKASWNRYSYVEGDPVNDTDTSGLMKDAKEKDHVQWPPPIIVVDITLLPAWLFQRVERVPRDPRTSASERAEDQLEAVRGAIERAVSPDSVFPSEIMECISGIETGRDWDPNETRYTRTGAVSRVGLYQFDRQTWNDTARQIGSTTTFESGARSVHESTVMAQALLLYQAQRCNGR
jgi:hypothetical protein